MHDIGHLPFSHTFEGVYIVERHRLDDQRLRELTGAFTRHGLTQHDVNSVAAAATGSAPQPLSAPLGSLFLDHLDPSCAAPKPMALLPDPRRLLDQQTLVDGVVRTDSATADHLEDFVVAGARSQTS